MIIGLTGGIGAGKTLAAGELKRLGSLIIDADKISREVVKKKTPAYSGIIKRFGKTILKKNGSLNRKTLGKIVFGNSVKLKALNRITHPRIIKEIKSRIGLFTKKHPEKLIVLNAPLLIEAGLNNIVDKVIVVYAKEESRIKRIQKRDGISEEEARLRLNSQMPLEEKLKFADFIINGDKGKRETLREVRKLYSELKKKL